MKKKGFITATITVGLLLVVALILVIIFGGFAFFTWLLGVNIYRLIGAAMIIIYLLSLFKGIKIPGRIGITILIIGAVLVFLPWFFDVLKTHTLATAFS